MYQDWKHVTPKTMTDKLERAMAWIAGIAIVLILVTGILDKLNP